MDMNDSMPVLTTRYGRSSHTQGSSRPGASPTRLSAPGSPTPSRSPSPIKHPAGSLTPVARARQLQSQYVKRTAQSPMRSNQYDEDLVGLLSNNQMQQPSWQDQANTANVCRSSWHGNDPQASVVLPSIRSVATTAKVNTCDSEVGDDILIDIDAAMKQHGDGCACPRERGGGGCSCLRERGGGGLTYPETMCQGQSYSSVPQKNIYESRCKEIPNELYRTAGDNSYDLDPNMDYDYKPLRSTRTGFDPAMVTSPIGRAIPGPSFSGRGVSPIRSPTSGSARGDTGCYVDTPINFDVQCTPNRQMCAQCGLEKLPENQSPTCDKLATKMQRHLADLESSERERINCDLTLFQLARRRLVEGTASISSCKPPICLDNNNIIQ